MRIKATVSCLFIFTIVPFFSVLMAQSSIIGNESLHGEVIKGERPPINLAAIPIEAMEGTIIRVKFKESLGDYLDHLEISKNSNGIIEFGIPSIDQLNRKYLVNASSKTFFIALQQTASKVAHHQWGFHLWYDLIVPAGTDIHAMVSDYALLSNVSIAEPVYKKQLVGEGENLTPEIGPANKDNPNYIPNDPYYTQQWNYDNTGQGGGTVDADIDLPEAWEITKGNSNVIVAVNDEGISYTHQDLAANMWSGIGYNFVDNCTTIYPGNHGTHVAGTIAANTNNGVGVSGIAGGEGTGNGVRLMSCQIANPAWTIYGGIENAFVWAADHGAAISQNSWSYSASDEYEQSVLDAIDYFNANGGGSVLDGGISIFAAGNTNSEAQIYPACYSGALSVAATNNHDIKASYSTYNIWVDISAPGGESGSAGVLSTYTNNCYSFSKGTSMACPHASGVAALIISLAPGKLTAQEVKDILFATTDNINALNPTYIGKLGSGRLNAHNALLLTQNYINPAIPAPPQNFTASTVSTNQINLNWALNASSDSVVLAYNSTYLFGKPSGNYLPGQTIAGGGTVLYKGKLSSFNHLALNSCAAYYYALWSKNGTNYSVVALKANDTTSATLPFNENFNNGSMPANWTQQISPNGTYTWSISNSSYAGGVAYEMKSKNQSLNPGTTRLVTPAISTTGISLLTLSFRHKLFAYGADETLKVQSSSDGITWTDEAWAITTNANVNATVVNTTIIHNLNSATTYIAFTLTGDLSQYSWYVDLVSIKAPCYWVGGTSGTPLDWNTPTNWAYGFIPTSTTNVYIPAGPFLPVVNSVGMICNDLTIANNATLTINPGKILTVLGNLILNAGN